MALAPYAMDVARSAGRRYPQPAHPYRNDYQRDRDRIIHARAFRRLEAKTQVFTRRYSDHFRNRLTHTLEVAQIARTVAGALALNTDLTEALALVHDIGHPPFGHAGERKLDELMREYGDGFDHNLHALRIVEHFEQRYADCPGLNLTYEVREGIVKHSRDYSPDSGDPASYPELADYRLAERPPLEAQLIDLVDEVAYNSADLDDGAEARLFDHATVRAEVPLFGCLWAEVEHLYPNAAPKLLFNESLRRLIDTLTTDLIDATRCGIESARVDSIEAVRAHSARLAAFSPDVAAENHQLKEFLGRRLYNHPQILEERQPAIAAVEELFRLYCAQPDRLPRSYSEQARSAPVHRVACDYIAGMTDTFLSRVHLEAVGGKNRPG